MSVAAYKTGCLAALANFGVKVGEVQPLTADWFASSVAELSGNPKRAEPELRRHKLERNTTWSAPASLESASAINWNSGIGPYGGV